MSFVRLGCVCAVIAWCGGVMAAPVLPGYLTDPSAMKSVLAKDQGYQPPAQFQYPYVSTYYVKPTVKAGEGVEIGFFVTDFASSKIRFLDDSHRFTAFIEYRLRKGSAAESGGSTDVGKSRIIILKDLKSGDHAFKLGKLPAGEYECRLWVKDAKGRESHRVIHDFRVVDGSSLVIPTDKVYVMSAADLTAYGLRNDGDVEELVSVATNGVRTVLRAKRAGVPGYTVTIADDPKTGKMPIQACKQAQLVYDAGYDKAAAERQALANVEGLQKLLDEKAAAGFRKVVLLKGTYRLSYTKSLFLPDGMTLDLNGATLKQNGFTGPSSVLVRLSSAVDAHLVNGTLEGDYWEHDYKGSPNNSEWPAGFELGGDTWYSSVEDVKVVDITGYGGQNGIAKDAKGWLSFYYDDLPKFAPGGLDAKTGEVDVTDKFRYTTDFKDLKKVLEKHPRQRLQISKHLGYQGRATRSWQMTVAWYDAEKKFISAETGWQYREMWIPEGAAFVRVSVEDESVESANKSQLKLTAMRLPINCAVKNCTFDHCRCVGYAASAMKNMLFEGNFFTRSGESAACCAFDAEDGWDQMQDVYFLKNVFRDNPRNNSILTCAGHNFILEGNDCDIYFWGRTHSPCVRGNIVGQATYRCDSRLRSGYGRFDDNTYAKGVSLGENEDKNRPDNWDYVLSGLDFDGDAHSFAIDVGNAGRVVGCSFKNMHVRIANAYACTFDNCSNTNSCKMFPAGRWHEVKVKDSVFKGFVGTNEFVKCSFENTRFNNAQWNGLVSVRSSRFKDCALFGYNSASLTMRECELEGTTVSGNYWEKPSDFLFDRCTIRLPEDRAFLKVGVYTIGKIGFDKCTVSGKQSLVNVSDLRAIQRYGNDRDFDQDPGKIVLRQTKVTTTAKKIIDHDASKNSRSPKKITVSDKGGNVLSKDAVLVEDLPATWSLQ